MTERKRQDDEARQKTEAEVAEKKRLEDEGRQKAEADAAARREAEEAAKKAAEAVENGLRLTVPDRQHVQIALGALGFPTGGTDGNFRPRTREAIAAWQKARNDPSTGYLTDAQNQTLLRDAAPAIARFNEEQKKLEEAKKKVEEAKAKAEAAARASPPPAAAPSTTAAGPKSGPDGVWRGSYRCTASRSGSEFTIGNLQIVVSGGTGTWVRPGSGPTSLGNHSLSIKLSGSQATVSRVYTPHNQVGVFQTAVLTVRHDGNSITGSGPEQNSGGRSCDIALTRAQ